jgi:hypothetical protein
MAFIGTPLDTRNTFQSLVGKRFSGDGSTTAFTLDVAPSSTLDLEVFVGNVRQDPNSAYTLSGTTLTFTGAPPSGTNNIYVVHQAKSVGTIDPPATESVAKTFSSTVQLGGTADMNGTELILDADADTSITADTDDQIDIKIAGADDFKFTANNFNILSGSTLTVDSGATITNSGTATGFGAVTQLNQTTISSAVNNITFDSTLITDDHSSYMIRWKDIGVSGNSAMGVRLGTSGSLNTGNVYNNRFITLQDTNDLDGNAGSASSRFSFGGYQQNHSSGNIASGEAILLNIRTNSVNKHILASNIFTGSKHIIVTGGGVCTETGVINIVGFGNFGGSENMTSGTVTLYGFK